MGRGFNLSNRPRTHRTVGPLDSDNTLALLKAGAALSITSAVAEKYAGLGSTTLTDFVKSQPGFFNTNAVIALLTYGAHILGDNLSGDYDAGTLAATMWVASLLLKLKDSNFDIVGTAKDDPLSTATAVLTAVLAWA